MRFPRKINVHGAFRGDVIICYQFPAMGMGYPRWSRLYKRHGINSILPFPSVSAFDKPLTYALHNMHSTNIGLDLACHRSTLLIYS
jgi:hypothetical protein